MELQMAAQLINPLPEPMITSILFGRSMNPFDEELHVRTIAQHCLGLERSRDERAIMRGRKLRICRHDFRDYRVQ